MQHPKWMLRTLIYTSDFAWFEAQLGPDPWESIWVYLGDRSGEDQGEAEGLLGHGGGCWAPALWLNQKKQELFCFSVLPLWAGQGWGQHQPSCALLATECRAMGIFTAQQWSQPCGVHNPGYSGPGGDVLVIVGLPFFCCVRSSSIWWLWIVEKSQSSQVLNNISPFLPVMERWDRGLRSNSGSVKLCWNKWSASQVPNK